MGVGCSRPASADRTVATCTSGLSTRQVPGSSGPADLPRKGPARSRQIPSGIVYSSDDSGRAEVYVAPLVGGPEAPIAGRFPRRAGSNRRFSADGKTIYYQSARSIGRRSTCGSPRERSRPGRRKRCSPCPGHQSALSPELHGATSGGAGFMTIQPPSTKTTSIRVRAGK